MELIRASKVTPNRLYKLVDTNHSIDVEKLLLDGYVIKQSDRLEGCFVLENTTENRLWLRQMYITKDAVTSLPALLEAILALAENEQTDVIIHSHHETLDTVLEALQFFQQAKPEPVDNLVDNSGKWWIYKVS